MKNKIFQVCIMFNLFLIPGLIYCQAQQGPLSPGTITITALAGSTTSWSNTGNIAVSDNVYARNASNLPLNGNYTNYLVGRNFGFSIPSGATINGIIVTIERRDINDRTADHHVRIIKNGTVGATDRSIGGRWPSAETVASYGSNTDLWGETWTDADINSANFGIALSIERSGGGPIIQARIDHVTISVFYTDNFLGLDLVDMNAWQSEDHIKLSWTTASEVNTDFFNVIRRNPDGSQQTISTIQSLGDSASITEYESSDKPFLSGHYMYFLFETELDGITKELGFVEVVFESTEILSILPNEIYFPGQIPKIHIWSPNTGNATFRLMDSQGKLTYEKTFHLSIGENEIELESFQTEGTGVYFAYCQMAGHSVIGKIIYIR